jgi:hypothetical protein
VSDGRNWIWHYIRNIHDRGLGYRWPKAELRRALGSPLEPKKVDCNRYFVTGIATPDDNPPITFGTNEATQRAAVFAETKTAAAPSTGSIIETSYRTASGSVEDVRVTVSTSQGETDETRWQLRIEQTPNVALALSMPTTVNSEQFTSLSRQLDGGGPIKTTDRKILAGLYSETELQSRLDQSYLVLNGKLPKVLAAIPAAALRPFTSDLMILDRNGRPLFATTVRMLVPDSSR